MNYSTYKALVKGCHSDALDFYPILSRSYRDVFLLRELWKSQQRSTTCRGRQLCVVPSLHGRLTDFTSRWHGLYRARTLRCGLEQTNR
jgi:hypothetical protein